ncbi:heme ABC exporter, ATP-binding protein CcmA [Paenibacillus uliginis N3/975]|uniref:Heme ABC exporter, ATP-binding protein CcmA n=1 Tax=Paenibacillus uliginis N3/975 TaxID=1313296 RepID=A0A1X7G9S8_9BACL|nr:heme ABC exporter ATP-binding protein CcmA [Paenibacillus uliginis]SMF65976.1 heme ABC exporter, ATP-binding protein CcmA [Paenibacillus uliginis N3/975]
MSDKVLQLEEVTKSIKTQTIVQPISFSLEPGDVLALCGGNGAGKSTILRMITGIVKPTAGTIRVNGLQWAKDRKTYADSIGYMPDDFQFGDALTAQETLQFYASLRNAPKERVTELLQMTGLKEFGHKKVSAYSKGMRQRLLFAQAMLAKPPLLILDEPTNGLDPFWMDSFSALVRQNAKEGQTIVFSTHQLNVAEQTADQVIFLDAGQVRYSGSADQLKQQYRNAGGLYGAFSDLVAVY